MKNGKQIKVLIMDVDGTMTDGKINMGNNGEMFKAFDVKDGYAIHELLPNRGVKTAIITGRKSSIVENRAKELDIDIVIQGEKDKERSIHIIARQLGVDESEMAYIGDDEADYDAMRICGVRGCPADAIQKIKDLSEFVSRNPGGRGAIREFSEWLIEGGYC